MEIHLMSSCLLLNSRLTPEASATPQLVHSIGTRCLGTSLSISNLFFFVLVESELQKKGFCHKRSTIFKLSDEKQTNGKED